jgi:hypothetical protein
VFRFAVVAARVLCRAALTAALVLRSSSHLSSAALSSAALSSPAVPALDGARR